MSDSSDSSDSSDVPPKRIFVKSRPWCTQEQIRPISKAALKHEASERTKVLAKPKKHNVEEANISLDSLPLPISPAALNAKCSERIKELAKSKVENQQRMLQHIGEPEGRDNPPPPPKEISDRLKELAIHKDYSGYQYNHRLPIPVPFAALVAEASPRTIELAEPNKRPDPEGKEQTVSRNALDYVASEHICKLAKHKKFHPEFRRHIPLPHPVPPEALQYEASPHMAELAKAKERGPTYFQRMCNRNAFQVRPEALFARSSKRIKELAKPVDR